MSRIPPIPWRGGVIPAWAKVAWLAWLAVWVPVYWLEYGPVNFLWFCDTANFVLAVAILWESPLIFSAQAAGVLILQLLWCVDYFGRLLFGVHLLGGTEYMFDASIPAAVRALSLFHLVVPILLVWACLRFGYDRHGWRLERWILGSLVAVAYLTPNDLNLNWSRRPFGLEPPLPLWAWAPLAIVLYPAIILTVTHQILVRLLPTRRAPAGAPASDRS